jgi:acyl phosphate:glycerol-3-phosphate acyltransferase
MRLLSILLLAYLIGAIPTAYLIARLHHMNIFAEGSGNMGTSNVARLLGIPWGALTFVLDILKGIVAVSIMIAAMRYDPILITLAAAASISGHNWSIFATILAYDSKQDFKIRGGKGAATGFGSFFWIAPPYIIVLMLIVTLIVVAFTRTFSIAAIASWLVAFLWLLISILSANYEQIWTLYMLVVTVLVFVKVVGNLQQIFAGSERKL